MLYDNDAHFYSNLTIKMKNIALIVTFCFATAFAVLVVKDVDSLIERAEKLFADTKKIVTEHKANDRAHLISTVEHELSTLEKIVAELKSFEKNATTRTNQLNVLEEHLLWSENQLSAELEFVEDVYKNYNSTNKTANALIEYGQVLWKEAQTEIKKHQGHGQLFELVSLEFEAKSIENVLKRLQAHPTVTVSQYDEQILIRLEKTVRNLIQRLQHV